MASHKIHFERAIDSVYQPAHCKTIHRLTVYEITFDEFGFETKTPVYTRYHIVTDEEVQLSQDAHHKAVDSLHNEGIDVIRKRMLFYDI